MNKLCRKCGKRKSEECFYRRKSGYAMSYLQAYALRLGDKYSEIGDPFDRELA